MFLGLKSEVTKCSEPMALALIITHSSPSKEGNAFEVKRKLGKPKPNAKL